MLTLAEVNLEHIAITNLDFKENNNFKVPSEGLKVDIAINAKYKILKKENKGLVRVAFEVFPEKNKAPFYLLVEAEGAFNVQKGKDINQLKEFCEFNAPAIIFPYIRETVDSITARSRFPRMTIPLINMYASLKKEPKSQNKPASKKK